MRNSRVPVLGTSRSRRGVAVVDIESSLAGRSLIEGPHDFVAMHWDHEPTPTPPRRGTGTTRTNTSFLLGRVGGGSVHGVPPMPPRGVDAVSKHCPEACKALEVDYSHGAVHSGYWRCGGRSIPCTDARSTPRCGPVLLPLV